MSDVEKSHAEKPVPTIEAANCAPPNEDYDFFENCEDNPFKYDAERFEMVNAWWLAEASLLAYSEPDFAIPRFGEIGFDEVVCFSGKSTQCYAMHNDDFVIVAFSGSDMRHRNDTDTISDVMRDWMVNLNAMTVEAEDGGCVHRGFTKALEEVWDPQDRPEDERLEPYLDSICDDGRKKVWFTGHSLGAALATIAAGRYDCATELYTFGSPRVGDEEYVENLDCEVHRFVNGDDIVCKVPLLANSYRHAGEARLLGGSPEEEAEERDESGGLLQRAKDVIGAVTTDARTKLLGALPSSSFTDHAPIFYAVHIWNEYVRERNAGS